MKNFIPQLILNADVFTEHSIMESRKRLELPVLLFWPITCYTTNVALICTHYMPFYCPSAFGSAKIFR